MITLGLAMAQISSCHLRMLLRTRSLGGLTSYIDVYTISMELGSSCSLQVQ